VHHPYVGVSRCCTGRFVRRGEIRIDQPRSLSLEPERFESGFSLTPLFFLRGGPANNVLLWPGVDVDGDIHAAEDDVIQRRRLARALSRKMKYAAVPPPAIVTAQSLIDCGLRPIQPQLLRLIRGVDQRLVDQSQVAGRTSNSATAL
jgi:hypothetical protein